MPRPSPDAGWPCCLCARAALEMHLRRLLRRGTGREVSRILMEAGHARPDAVGELKHEGVVVLQRVVVTLARHGDAVFAAGELVLQAHELVARAQLRVVFREREQAAQG